MKIFFAVSVFVIVAVEAEENLSMLVNGIKVHDGDTFEYNYDSVYTITCSSNQSYYEKNKFMNLTIAVYTESEDAETYYSEVMAQKYSYNVTHEHALDLWKLSFNTTRTSCVLLRFHSQDIMLNMSVHFIRKTETGPENYTMAPEKPQKSLDFVSGVGVGVAVGIATTILLGYLCRLICKPKPPRPRMPTPRPESDYYASVYSWRK